MKRQIIPWIGLLVGLTCALPLAEGQAIFTFGYTDLDGAFDGGSTWTMNASQDTSGDVTRHEPNVQTADFDSDFTSSGADFSLSMSLSDLDMRSATGTGTFTITDIDGDTITGEMTGTWIRITPRETAFTGVIQNAYLNGESFDGSSGGSVDLDVGQLEPLNGALVVLHASGWFDRGAFTDRTSLIQGNLLPVPGAALLALIGVGTVGIIRRRWGSALC